MAGRKAGRKRWREGKYMCQAFAVFFMLYVIQSSQHPFEVVYFCFLFSDGETEAGRDWTTSP